MTCRAGVPQASRVALADKLKGYSLTEVLLSLVAQSSETDAQCNAEALASTRSPFSKIESEAPLRDVWACSLSSPTPPPRGCDSS